MRTLQYDPPTPAAPSAAQLHVTVGLIAKILVVLAIGVSLWLLAADPADRLATAVVLPALLVGLIGGHGLANGESRVPTTLQGFLVGGGLGLIVAAVLLADARLALLVWVIPLVTLHRASCHDAYVDR